ncbi:MAG TPA: hypothetical protein VJR89_40145 [Polyangiales bacterium]|nr:hypothetical protein [Polyangiales bacterium]
MLLVYRRGKLPEPEFTQFMQGLPQQYSRLTGLVVVPNGSVPTAAQRGIIKDFQTRTGVRAAVLTDSALVRGVVTAMAWFGIPLAAFAERDAIEALQYAGIPRPQLAEAERALAALRQAAAQRPTGT